MKLFPINEVVGACFYPQMDEASIDSLRSDARSFLKARFDMDIENDIVFVENGSDTVHLALPYYSFVEEFSADSLPEGAMDDVSGGEIFISICALIGTAVGIGVAAGVTGVAYTAAVIGCGVAGGIAGAAVTGAAVGGAVAASDAK